MTRKRQRRTRREEWSEAVTSVQTPVTSVLAFFVSYRLEYTGVPILPHLVPIEAPAVHRDVDAGPQHLHERQCAAEVEQTIRAAEGVRDHRASENDGLVAGARIRVGQRAR